MELTNEQKLYGEIVQKAWEDPEFKQALMDSPAEAIEAATGQAVDVPAGKALKVVDQSDPNYAYLNIPARPNMDDLELSDEQLEMVAGGEFIATAIIVSAITTAIGTAGLTYTIGKDKKSSDSDTAEQ